MPDSSVFHFVHFHHRQLPSRFAATDLIGSVQAKARTKETARMQEALQDAPPVLRKIVGSPPSCPARYFVAMPSSMAHASRCFLAFLLTAANPAWELLRSRPIAAALSHLGLADPQKHRPSKHRTRDAAPPPLPPNCAIAVARANGL